MDKINRYVSFLIKNFLKKIFYYLLPHTGWQTFLVSYLQPIYHRYSDEDIGKSVYVYCRINETIKITYKITCINPHMYLPLYTFDKRFHSTVVRKSEYQNTERRRNNFLSHPTSNSKEHPSTLCYFSH